MMTNKKRTEPDIVADILKECAKIHEVRDIQYGGSYENFTDVAAIASRLSLSGIRFNALDIAVCMVAIKEARYKYALNHPKMKNHAKVVHDSLVDWINYIAIMENVRILTQTKNKEVKNGPKNS